MLTPKTTGMSGRMHGRRIVMRLARKSARNTVIGDQYSRYFYIAISFPLMVERNRARVRAAIPGNVPKDR